MEWSIEFCRTKGSVFVVVSGYEAANTKDDFFT